MYTKRSRLSLSPVRVRHEPPTVAEAGVAAQALTPDLEQQVEITAGLIGLAPGEVRPFVLEAISAGCPRQRESHPGRGCRAYYPDLPPTQPSDLPADLWPQRLRLIMGGRSDLS